MKIHEYVFAGLEDWWENCHIADGVLKISNIIIAIIIVLLFIIIIKLIVTNIITKYF